MKLKKQRKHKRDNAEHFKSVENIKQALKPIDYTSYTTKGQNLHPKNNIINKEIKQLEENQKKSLQTYDEYYEGEYGYDKFFEHPSQ
mmetsp:Transcript_22726/g.19754  ORF Transcript_22726/g.19754 Transcript_22726/m.19754 type:complete len:87 (+) Transcript_22726:737-997(+)